jgi:hypothetical protein
VEETRAFEMMKSYAIESVEARSDFLSHRRWFILQRKSSIRTGGFGSVPVARSRRLFTSPRNAQKPLQCKGFWFVAPMGFEPTLPP